MFQGFKMRNLFLFLPAVVIPLTFQIISSGKPSSTATVNIRSTPTQPLPPLALLPEITPVAPTVSADHPSTSAKKQPQKVIAQKHPPKTESTENKVNTRPYNAPAIEIRVAIAPAHSQSFAQRDVKIPIEPNQMVTAELVGSSLKLNYCGLSRAIVYLKEQYAVGNIEVKI